MARTFQPKVWPRHFTPRTGPRVLYATKATARCRFTVTCVQ